MYSVGLARILVTVSAAALLIVAGPAVAAAAPAPMPVAAAPPKRLSRLEQLREDAKAKAGQPAGK